LLSQAEHVVAVPPAEYVAPVHWLQVWPETIEPALAWNATEIVALVGHVLEVVAFFLIWPALQYVLMFVALRVSKHCVTAVQPLPVPCVQLSSAVGQLFCTPEAQYVAPVHCD
jgi:hypothetical protein